MSLSPRSKWRLFAVVAAASLTADLVSKWLAHAFLSGGKPVTVIDGYWDFVLAANPGAAFSMLADAALGRIVLSVVGVVAIGVIFHMARTASATRTVWSLGLVLGGAIGNLFERVAFGKVTDFVLWHYHEHAWPVFNIADVVLVVGVGMLLLDMLARGRHPHTTEAS